MRRIVAGTFWAVAAVHVVMPWSAQATDIPVTGNRAAEEIRQIEEAIAAAPEASFKSFQLYSFIANKMLWPTSPLNVCFWNGTTALRDDVSRIADELTAGTTIKFTWKVNGAFVDCGTNWATFPVRVSLERRQDLLVDGDNPAHFFALIGRQLASGRKATINLPFAASPTTQDLRNKVLHEFCHVLGCLHEHQRGVCENHFDRDAIKLEFNLNDDQYHKNFATLPSTNMFGPSALGLFDQTSVMMYRFKQSMFKPGVTSPCRRDSFATSLSSGDIAGLNAAYSAARRAGGLRRIEDFDRLNRLNRDEAEKARGEALALDTTIRNWVMRTPFLESNERVDASAQLRTLQEAALERAAKADVRAAAFDLTPKERAELLEALQYLPSD